MSIFRGAPWPGTDIPLFTDDDRDHRIAAVLNKADSCPGCGEPMSVSTSIESDGKYAADAMRCHGCAAQSRAANELSDKSNLLVAFTRRPDPEGD